jgi:hypothetical protein
MAIEPALTIKHVPGWHHHQFEFIHKPKTPLVITPSTIVPLPDEHVRIWVGIDRKALPRFDAAMQPPDDSEWKGWRIGHGAYNAMRYSRRYWVVRSGMYLGI